VAGQAPRLIATALVTAALSLALGVPASAQSLVATGACRDGQPHGAYAVRSPDDKVRVTGAFNHGKRTGSFLFWNAAGVRVAHIPYDDDVRNGTLALWFGQVDRGGEPRRQLQAGYARGRLTGVKRSWYPTGAARTELRYERGVLVSARAYSDSGRDVAEADARALAERDAEADERLIATFEGIVRNNLPQCQPTPER